MTHKNTRKSVSLDPSCDRIIRIVWQGLISQDWKKADYSTALNNIIASYALIRPETTSLPAHRQAIERNREAMHNRKQLRLNEHEIDIYERCFKEILKTGDMNPT